MNILLLGTTPARYLPRVSRPGALGPRVNLRVLSTAVDREETIHLSGCSSWYLSPEGKNTSLYPGFSFEYCLKSKFRARHYKMD